MLSNLSPAANQFASDLLGSCLFERDQNQLSGPAVCAVSGGADSLALLILARSAGLEVVAAHVDHGLRPESAREAETVAAAAQLVGASFRSLAVNLEDGPNLEARAREARKSELGPGALTGHTADDQAETLLINLLRGTGVAGLAAMQPGGIHPILAIRRADTVELCRLAGLDPVQDPSNRDSRFVRNRVRHELLPLMEEISGREIIPLLVRTASAARSNRDLVSELAADIDPTDCASLREMPTALAAESLRNWLRSSEGYVPSASDLERVFDVVHNRNIACEISGRRRVSRTNGVLRIDIATVSS